MSKRILERLPNGYTYTHTEDGVTRVGTYADHTDIVEQVKGRRGMGMTQGDLGIHEASIPLNLLDEWARKISGGQLGAFDVSSDNALLDRFLAEHPSLKVHKGWQ